MTVRAAVPADLAAVLDLYRQLYPELEHDETLRVQDAWASTMTTPGRTVLVAEAAGTVVGTADVTVVANTAHAGEPYLLVENVVVDGTHRRTGVGATLLGAAREHGRRTGCYKLQLSADDPAAFAFYEAVGLRPAARTYKEYLG
ncbi:N-acetyltransferase family protein [Blastococcus sp. SYSU DS0828]